MYIYNVVSFIVLSIFLVTTMAQQQPSSGHLQKGQPNAVIIDLDPSVEYSRSHYENSQPTPLLMPAYQNHNNRRFKRETKIVAEIYKKAENTPSSL